MLLPFSGDNAERYVDLLINDKSRRTFAIQINNQHVGNIGLKKYFPNINFCELFIEIGEANFRGRGIGTAAMRLILDYAFGALKIQDVNLEVLEFNHAAIRVYERLGFCNYGITGWHYDALQRRWNVFGMRLNLNTWQQVKSSLRLAPNIVLGAILK